MSRMECSHEQVRKLIDLYRSSDFMGLQNKWL